MYAFCFPTWVFYKGVMEIPLHTSRGLAGGEIVTYWTHTQLIACLFTGYSIISGYVNETEKSPLPKSDCFLLKLLRTEICLEFFLVLISKEAVWGKSFSSPSVLHKVLFLNEAEATLPLFSHILKHNSDIQGWDVRVLARPNLAAAVLLLELKALLVSQKTTERLMGQQSWQPTAVFIWGNVLGIFALAFDCFCLQISSPVPRILNAASLIYALLISLLLWLQVVMQRSFSKISNVFESYSFTFMSSSNFKIKFYF